MLTLSRKVDECKPLAEGTGLAEALTESGLTSLTTATLVVAPTAGAYTRPLFGST